jgi:hypothetical protein
VLLHVHDTQGNLLIFLSFLWFCWSVFFCSYVLALAERLRFLALAVEVQQEESEIEDGEAVKEELKQLVLLLITGLLESMLVGKEIGSLVKLATVTVIMLIVLI